MRIDISKCPVCNKGLKKWCGKKIYKCENGGHILALEFESDLRDTEEEKVLWVEPITKKEYLARIVE